MKVAMVCGVHGSQSRPAPKIHTEVKAHGWRFTLQGQVRFRNGPERLVCRISLRRHAPNIVVRLRMKIETAAA